MKKIKVKHPTPVMSEDVLDRVLDSVSKSRAEGQEWALNAFMEENNLTTEEVECVECADNSGYYFRKKV